MFANVRIVLVSPSHPGNIGAVARAMKAMDLSRLYLVNPKIFPHVEATARAAGADDLLAQAVITSSLSAAVADCHLVFGTSARIRALPLTLLSPRIAAQKILHESVTRQIAVVFGRENNGLTNEELAFCHEHIYIPTNVDFNSLNLAAAVQIVAYEINLARHEQTQVLEDFPEVPVTIADLTLFYKTLENVLVELRFLNAQNPQQLMLRLRRLFNRIRLDKLEFNILMGILTAITRQLEN